MKLLVVGSGSGSWTMRGQQLGAALGARVTSSPTSNDWRWADVAILVKRFGARLAPHAKAVGVPVVWDALDCWRQPMDNVLGEGEATARLRAQAQATGARLVIGATEAQAAAVGGVYLPHHSWAGLTPAPVRETVRTVAYQGGAAFLGHWRDRLERLCTARGWRFVVNPPDIGEADILVALRDGMWDGWQCRRWKSGVKLANAIAAGRPVITQPSAAFDEIRPPGTLVETPHDLEAALVLWASYERRLDAAEAAATLAGAYTVEAVADRYRRILEGAAAICTH